MNEERGRESTLSHLRLLQYYPAALAGEFGTAESVRGWCRALTNAGAEVTLVVDRDLQRLLPPENIDVIALQHTARGPLRIPRGFRQLLPDHDLVVLHGALSLHPAVAGHATARAGLPYVATPHGAYQPMALRRRTVRKRVWRMAFEDRYLRGALAAHLFFPDEKPHLARLAPGSRVIVAPNGLSVAREIVWDGGSGGYLAWLGRFDIYTKGLDLLVRALSLVPTSIRPLLRLHGPDPRGDKQLLGRLVRDLGLARWVTLGDALYGDKKWELLTGAAGFVCPSRFDACGIALGEAVAAGIPALATPFPLGRLLASRGAAIECSYELPSIAEGIKKLLSSEASAIGRAGAEIAITELGWDAQASRWLQQAGSALHEPISGPRPPEPPPTVTTS